jgi:hypothetical protein
MGIAATSVTVRAASPSRVADQVCGAIGSLARPAGGVVFVSGTLGLLLPEIARTLAASGCGIPLLLCAAAGVISDRGAAERQATASALVWAGGSAETLCVSSAAALGPELVARRATTALVTVAAPAQDLGQFCGGVTVFGAGVDAVQIIGPDGSVRSGEAAAMLLGGGPRAHVGASVAARLLAPPDPVTLTDGTGSLVLRVGDEPALDRLEIAGRDVPPGQLVLAAVACGDLTVLLPIRGIDPVRRGVMVAGVVPVGTPFAFAIQDPVAARQNLQKSLRDLARAAAGGAPGFGFYLASAERGARFYGAEDVDVHELRAAFPELPFAGLCSSFEIAPLSDGPALLTHSGVLALFTAPS